MSNEFVKVVEINGIKMEVDLRTAKRVDQFKVGDSVKVLVKDYSDYKSYAGVIIGFDEFQNLPTIVVAYIKEGYSDMEIKFVFINSQSKDMELAPLQEFECKYDYNKAMEFFNNHIEKKQRELDEIIAKKEWFILNVNKYFPSFVKVES